MCFMDDKKSLRSELRARTTNAALARVLFWISGLSAAARSWYTSGRKGAVARSGRSLPFHDPTGWRLPHDEGMRPTPVFSRYVGWIERTRWRRNWVSWGLFTTYEEPDCPAEIAPSGHGDHGGMSAEAERERSERRRRERERRRRMERERELKSRVCPRVLGGMDMESLDRNAVLWSGCLGVVLLRVSACAACCARARAPCACSACSVSVSVSVADAAVLTPRHASRHRNAQSSSPKDLSERKVRYALRSVGVVGAEIGAGLGAGGLGAG